MGVHHRPEGRGILGGVVNIYEKSFNLLALFPPDFYHYIVVPGKGYYYSLAGKLKTIEIGIF